MTRCRDCRHFCAVYTYGAAADGTFANCNGNCRRRAPDGNGWPCVDGEDWCSEYEGREQGEAMRMTATATTQLECFRAALAGEGKAKP